MANDKEPQFKTDLSERERKRYAGMLREIATHADEAADAVEAGNDPQFLMAFFILSLSGSCMREIQEILITTMKDSSKTEEFPSVIGD